MGLDSEILISVSFLSHRWPGARYSIRLLDFWTQLDVSSTGVTDAGAGDPNAAGTTRNAATSAARRTAGSRSTGA
jgi:hypothetical protein